ncbi:MAG TPA: hypothetical protein VFB80_02230 [Pirellulaceae bacterium]|nr:hypothetical protein [Pirellulaceae bacterium]
MPDEVEEFLRRVAQMRAQAEAQARAQQQRPKPQPAPPPPRPAAPPPPARLVPARQEMVPLEPVEVEIVDAELAEIGDSVGRHVTQHLRGTEEIAEHTRHLGEEVDQADDKLESHLHQVFDHQLGKLKKTASTTAAAPYDSPASDMSELLQMLRSPKSVRDAIVMAEVLRRPDDRW